jgi:CRISPR/Cas system-associated protein Csm6
MTHEEAETTQHLLILLNKILYYVGETSQGRMSPEVGMENIISEVMKG